MRLTLAELRDIIEFEVLLEAHENYVPASKAGVTLMKGWVSALKGMGYRYSPEYFDSREGVVWPVVLRDYEKVVFEYDGEMYVKDEIDDDWIVLRHEDMKRAIARYAHDVHIAKMKQSQAYAKFIDSIRLASHM